MSHPFGDFSLRFGPRSRGSEGKLQLLDHETPFRIKRGLAWPAPGPGPRAGVGLGQAGPRSDLRCQLVGAPIFFTPEPNVFAPFEGPGILPGINLIRKLTGQSVP